MIKYFALFGEMVFACSILLGLFWLAQLRFGSSEDIEVPIWLSKFIRKQKPESPLVISGTSATSTPDNLIKTVFVRSAGSRILTWPFTENQSHIPHDEEIVKQILLARKRIIEEQISSAGSRVLSESEATREVRKNILRDKANAKETPAGLASGNVITENMLRSMQAPETVM